MRSALTLAILVALLAPGMVAAYGTERPSEAEVRQRIVAESRRWQVQSCPCPYSLNRAGVRCGDRSHWSRPWGLAPLCYPVDVLDERVREYREHHGL